MDWPNNRFPVLNTITPWSLESLGLTLLRSGYTPDVAISNVPGANTALFYPFRIFEPSTAVKMACVNGATVNGNVDLGIYDRELNKIVSTGSTAQAGANAIQVIDITDTLLLPGNYFMAVELSSATGTLMRSTATDEDALSAHPFYTQAVGAFPLPATAAFAPSTDGNPSPRMIAVLFNATV